MKSTRELLTSYLVSKPGYVGRSYSDFSEIFRNAEIETRVDWYALARAFENLGYNGVDALINESFNNGEEIKAKRAEEEQRMKEGGFGEF